MLHCSWSHHRCIGMGACVVRCRKLRSVEAAAHLLQSFKRIQTQGAIQRQMNQKLTDVLEHFIKEARPSICFRTAS
jgi:hypothetical protein